MNIPELIERLRQDIETHEAYWEEEGDKNAIDWRMEKGVLISSNQARFFVELIKESKYSENIYQKILKSSNNDIRGNS